MAEIKTEHGLLVGLIPEPEMITAAEQDDKEPVQPVSSGTVRRGRKPKEND